MIPAGGFAIGENAVQNGAGRYSTIGVNDVEPSGLTGSHLNPYFRLY
jgi:hypothetical protein